MVSGEVTVNAVIELLQIVEPDVSARAGGGVIIASTGCLADTQPSVTVRLKNELYWVELVAEVEDVAEPTIEKLPPVEVYGYGQEKLPVR